MKRTIAVVLCVAFSGMQMSFATVLTRGVDSFNNAQVLGGTGAVIRNASAGLKQIETNQTNATLRFDNHTKIDWSKFNVDNGQKLYFNNGTYGVLNVVTQGSISKIAGQITADNGKIIISNPNGILFNGGTFTSAGSLVLTTKDLTGLADDLNFNTYDIGTVAGGTEGAVVAVVGGTLTSPDINIIANGVHFDSATLSSPSANGVVLVTADGANYVAGAVKDANNNTVLETTSVPLNVANTTIQTQNGDIQLIAASKQGNNTRISESTLNGSTATVAGDMVLITDASTVNGNLTIKDNFNNDDREQGAYLNKSTVNGNLTVDAKDVAKIMSSNVSGSVDVDAIEYILLKGSTVGATDLNAYDTSYVRVESSTINGNLDVKGATAIFGNYKKTSIPTNTSVTVNGDLNVTSKYSTGFSDTVRANNITMTSEESSILAAHSVNGGNGKLIARDAAGNDGNITLTASNGAIITVEGEPASGASTSVYYDLMTGASGDYNVTLATLEPYYVDTKFSIEGKDATLTSVGRNTIDATLSGDLTLSAGENAYVSGNVAGNVDVTSTGGIQLSGLTVGGNADAKADMVQVLDGSNIAGNLNMKDTVDSSDKKNGLFVNASSVGGNVVADGKDIIKIEGSTVNGTVQATSDEYIVLSGSTVGSTTLNTHDKSYVRVDDTTVNGDLDMVASSIIFGNYKKLNVPSEGAVNVTGDITGLASWSIGFGTDVTANSIALTSTDSSVVQAIGSGTITSDSITINAPTGAVIGLEGNVDSGKSEYYIAMTTKYHPGTNGASDYGAVAIQSSNNGANDLALNFDTKVANVDAKAANTTFDVTNAGNTVQDLKLTATGNVDAQNINAVKAAADTDNTSGSVVVTSTNGNVKIGNVVGDTDVKVYAQNGNIEVTGKLIADNEDNGVGELNLTAQKAYNSGVADLTLGSANAGGANIIVDIVDGNITASGLTTDRHAAGDTSGNFILSTDNGNITVGDVIADTDLKIFAENGDITVTGKLIADNEDNGVGELNLTGKTAKDLGATDLTLNSTNAGGANIIVDIESGDITATGLTTDRHSAGDTSGNFVLSTDNGNITVGDVIADTDLKVLAENGDITVTGQLKADNEANGVGDLVIKGQTAKNLGSDDLTMTGTDFGGANIEVTIDNGNIIASGLTASQQGLTDDLAGNVNLTTGNGNISVGDIIADTDLKVIAENGQIDITGKLLADNDGNNVGDLVLRANTGDFNLDNTNGTNFTGANIEAVVNKGDITAIGLSATGNDDNNGNITIYTGEGNATVANTTATHDITITALKGTDDTKGFANVTNTTADSDANGQGKLTIVADNDVVASNAGGSNVVITSNGGDIEATNINTTAPNDNTQGDIIITANNGDVTVDGANGDHDVIITAGGDADVTNAHADKDGNKAGDLIINAGGKADVDNGTGHNVEINANDDITAKDITGDDDVIIISDNGKVTGENLIADGDGDDVGDLIVKGNGDVVVDGGHGADIEIVSDNGNITAEDLVADGDDKEGAPDGQGNITITADNGNVTVDGADATQDIVITAGGNADVTDAHADTDDNKHGDLIINAGGNADVEDGTGNNVHIDADGDIIVNDIEGKDDVIINAGGGVTGSDLIADGDDDGIGDLIINGNPVNITGTTDGVNVIINGVDINDKTLVQELMKNFNNLVQSGVDSQLAQSFTPIAFAADDDDEQSAIAKRIAKTVFKTPETGIVTITERYNSVK